MSEPLTTNPVLRGDKQCPHGYTARRKCNDCTHEDDQREIACLTAELASAIDAYHTHTLACIIQPPAGELAKAADYLGAKVEKLQAERDRLLAALKVTHDFLRRGEQVNAYNYVCQALAGAADETKQCHCESDDPFLCRTQEDPCTCVCHRL